jgi:hypothetical protein
MSIHRFSILYIAHTANAVVTLQASQHVHRLSGCIGVSNREQFLRANYLPIMAISKAKRDEKNNEVGEKQVQD